MAWGYYASGADEQRTLADNTEAFDRLNLRPRVLVDVSTRDLSTRVLERSIDLPVLVAPMAMQGLAHPAAENGTAQAAKAHGTVMVLSTFSNTPIEEVAAQVPTWFQLYVYRDREASAALVRRAEAAGCEALVVTVDAPVLGRRMADIRTGFHLPPDIPLPNLLDRDRLMRDDGHGSALSTFVQEMLDPSLSWKDIDWLRGVTDLPILLKGVLRADDARTAMQAGCAGVIVSNHGHRGGRRAAGHRRGVRRSGPDGRGRAAGDRHREGLGPGRRRCAVGSSHALGARAGRRVGSAGDAPG